GIAGLDANGIAVALHAEVQRVAAAGIIEVQVAGGHEHGTSRRAVAERGVAGLLVYVVGLGLDDASRQPQPVDAMANHGSQQFLGDQLRVPVEKSVVEKL